MAAPKGLKKVGVRAVSRESLKVGWTDEPKVAKKGLPTVVVMA